MHSVTNILNLEVMRPTMTDSTNWKNTIGGVLLMVLLLFSGSQVTAQGWFLRVDDNTLDQAEEVLTTIDGGHILLGFREEVLNGNRVNLVRTDVDGEVLWAKTFGQSGVRGYDIIEEANGDLVVVGEIRLQGQTNRNAYLLKVSQTGELISETVYEMPGNQVGRDIVAAADGGYVVVGNTDNTNSGEDDALAIRIDASLDTVWTRAFGGDFDERAFGVTSVESGFVLVGASDSENPDNFDNDILIISFTGEGTLNWQQKVVTDEAEQAEGVVTAPDGNIVLAGFQGNQSDVFVAKYDLEGNTIWTNILDNNGLSDQALGIKNAADGSFLLAGVTEITASNADIFVSRLNADGSFEWLRTLGSVESIDQGIAIDETIDGGYIVASTSTTSLIELSDDILLIKTDEGLNTLPNKITGSIESDLDAIDCSTFETSDFSHLQWVVIAEQGDKKFYGTTDLNGRFEIDVDTGEYIVTAFPNSVTWTTCSPEVVNFETTYGDPQDIVLTSSLQQSNADLRVSVSAPFVQEGRGVVFDVICFNEGSEDAENVRVEVQLDEEVSYSSFEISAPNLDSSDVENGFLVFFFNNIEAGESQRFQIIAEADEQSENFIDEQAVATSAIAKVSNNIPITGANLSVSFDSNTGRLGVRNTGPVISFPITGIVISDDIIFLRREIDPIPQSEEIEIELPQPLPDTGSTIRVLATQNGEGFNGFGSLGFEANGRNAEGTYSTGFFAQFPEDDFERNIEIDVQENIGSSTLDAFEMRGYPKGYRDSIIAQNTDLTYTIFFQNLGTQTVNRVVIRDTISDLLNPSSVSPGASNLDYEVEVYEGGIVKFIFDDINLVPLGTAPSDSTIDYGYVKFKVAQEVDLPLGSMIKNRATVFFDYESPGITNEVIRIVGDYPEFIETMDMSTSTNNTYIEGVKINLYPNPLYDAMKIDIEGKAFKEITFNIFDLTGKLVESCQYNSNNIMYYRNRNLPTGMYFYNLESEGQLINSGKLMIR